MRFSYHRLIQLIAGTGALTALTFSAVSVADCIGSQQMFEDSPEEFVFEAFDGEVPEPQRIWIVDDLKQQVEAILQHRATYLRMRYWLKGDLSVWIIDEIGKVKPITTGVVVRHDQAGSRIVEVEVLAFRESRGWEVRQSFFTDQFRNVRRGKRGGLQPGIDGITGATLSVNALEKVAEIALLLDEHVRNR